MGILVAEVWMELKNKIKIGDTIVTLKGKAAAKVTDLNDDRILLLLDKGEVRELKKDQVISAVETILDKGRVRQKDIPGNCERFILGALCILPQFQHAHEFVVSEGKKVHFVKII
jgi:preprotein translocase subunit YajC